MEASFATRKSPCYSVDELLGLRNALPRILLSVSRINKHSDIVGLFSLPYEAFQKPETFCCFTQLLPRIANKAHVPASRRRQWGNSTEDSEISTVSEMGNGKLSAQVRWNFRRRNTSERSSQPYSAPSGLVAQQAENFRRFYRAVISPTHVRVTAGGRIVPNTRSIAPLPFEWDSDKPDSDSRDAVDGAPNSNSIATGSQGQPYIHNGLLSPFPSAAPLRTPVFPIIPQHISNVAAEHPDQTDITSSRYTGMDDKTEVINQLGLPSLHQPHPMLLDGRMLYPILQGVQGSVGPMQLPLATLGNGNLLPSPIVPSNVMFRAHPPLAGIPRPFILPASTRYILQPHQTADSTTFSGPYQPFMANTSISELTRKQLQELHQLLQDIDYQLLNNRSHVEEAAILQQRAVVESQIGVMTGMLKTQLEVEANQKTSFTSDSSFGSALDSSTTATTSFASMAPSNVSTVMPKAEHSPQHRIEPPRELAGNAATTISGNVVPALSESKPRIASQSTSRLTAAAAKAPPFLPRSNCQNQLFGTSCTPESAGNMTIANQHPFTYATATVPGTDAQIHSTTALINAQSIPEKDNAHGVELGGYSTLQIVQVGNRIFPNQVQAIPYLVGTLPAGLKASDASPADLTYSRPLTDREVQARRQYWGKEPRQSGLPKFDGKDFYPPSPAKTYSYMATPEKSFVPTTGLLPEFSNLFTEPGVPGFRTPSPARPASSYPHLFSVAPSASPPAPHFGLKSSDFAYAGGQPTEVTVGNNALEPDFSKLFLEPGVPGYKAPEQTANGTFFLDTYVIANKANETSPGRNDSKSDTSTIEINLTPQIHHAPQTQVPVANTTDRLTKLDGKQQTQFLQNFLKNHANMTSPAMSGGVTIATAQGHLPAYRGTAAVSLLPAMLNVTGVAHEMNTSASELQQPLVVNGSTIPIKTPKPVSENSRPLSRAIPIVRPPDNLDAESYMRLIHNKQDITRTGTGPVMGSDW